MSTQSVPLNAEPADRDGRKEAGLAPKSFADAAQQDPPAENSSSNESAKPQANGTGADINGTASANGGSEAPKHVVGEGDENLKHSVLRIVDTGAETNGKEKARKDAKVENKGADKKDDEAGKEQEEFEAAGLDETPRSPQKLTKHRKTPSQSRLRPEPDTKPKGPKDENPDEKVVFEKFADKKNGELLTSVKPAQSYEKDVVQDRKPSSKAPKDEDKGLTSGRQALKSWERSGIRFAPWNIPLQRRLQTGMVLFHTLCIAGSVSLFFFLCAIPIFWPLLIPYLIYCLTNNASTSGTLSHRSDFLRSSSIWSLFASYYPARLHRSVDLPPTRKYVFGYHPHGIISHGAFAAFGTEALGFKQLFPGITNTLLTLDSNFRIPIYRDYALAMGLASVSRESCENILSKGGPNKEGMGRAITIVVGGARESLDAKPYTMRLVLKRRLGFIKIAVRTGADLVPVIAFGENDLYDQFLPDEHPQIHRFQLMVKKVLGFTIPLFHARGVFNYDVGLMPYRRPLNVVVGRPILVERQKEPEKEYLEKLHNLYIEEVQRLWDTWKGEFAVERKEELMIVE